MGRDVTEGSWRRAHGGGFASFSLRTLAAAHPLHPMCVIASVSAGCSLNFPMMSLVPEPEPETTASIVPNSSMLTPGLSPEDWTLASSALDKALDPQLNGAPTKWSNAETGARGSFAAAGPAYVRNDQVCRSFKATVVLQGPERQLLGTACRAGAGAWTLQKMKPFSEGT
jgi:surface antigen